MLKKFILLCCIIAAVPLCAAPKIKIANHTQAAVLETFLRAAAYGDAEVMWALIPPDVQAKFIKRSGSKEQALKEFWQGFRQSCPTNKSESFRQLISDPATKAAAIEYLIKNAHSFTIQQNGKWYIAVEQK